MSKINMTRLVFAALAAWVAWMVMGYIVNMRLMTGAYAEMQAHMRPQADMNQLLPLGFAFGLAGFLILSWIYAKGYEGGSGVSEGIRFGFLIGLLFVMMGIVWEFIVFPVTRSWMALALVPSNR